LPSELDVFLLVGAVEQENKFPILGFQFRQAHFQAGEPSFTFAPFVRIRWVLGNVGKGIFSARHVFNCDDARIPAIFKKNLPGNANTKLSHIPYLSVLTQFCSNAIQGPVGKFQRPEALSAFKELAQPHPKSVVFFPGTRFVAIKAENQHPVTFQFLSVMFSFGDVLVSSYLTHG
jgi:hypothetical protein